MIFAFLRPRSHHLSHISSRRTSPDLRTEIPCPPVSICFRGSKAGFFLRLASLSGRLVPVFPSPRPPLGCSAPVPRRMRGGSRGRRSHWTRSDGMRRLDPAPPPPRPQPRPPFPSAPDAPARPPWWMTGGRTRRRVSGEEGGRNARWPCAAAPPSAAANSPRIRAIPTLERRALCTRRAAHLSSRRSW